jgi:hypothetical protein
MRVIAFAALLGAVPASAPAVTLRVPVDYAGVSAAVAAARPGDTVVVAAGIYSPSRTGESFPLVLAGADLEIVGAGAGRTILDGEDLFRILDFGGSDRSAVRGLTLAGGSAPDGGGAVRVNGGSPELAGLRIEACTGGGSGDAILVQSGAPRVTNCLVTGHRQGPTIRLEGGSAVFEHVTVARNAGTAFLLAGDARPELRRCVVADAGMPSGPAVGLRIVSARAVPVLEDLLWSCQDEGVAEPVRASPAQLEALVTARHAGGLREGDPGFEDPGRGDFRRRENGAGVRPGLGAWSGPDPLPVPGLVAGTTPEPDEGPGLLGPPTPNPLSLSTTISFSVQDLGAVDLGVFNVLGQRVRTLYAGDLVPGEHTRIWDGRDDRGEELPPGIYFVRITQGRATESQRLVLIR